MGRRSRRMLAGHLAELDRVEKEKLALIPPPPTLGLATSSSMPSAGGAVTGTDQTPTSALLATEAHGLRAAKAADPPRVLASDLALPMVPLETPAVASPDAPQDQGSWVSAQQDYGPRWPTSRIVDTSEQADQAAAAEAEAAHLAAEEEARAWSPLMTGALVVGALFLAVALWAK